MYSTSLLAELKGRKSIVGVLKINKNHISQTMPRWNSRGINRHPDKGVTRRDRRTSEAIVSLL